LPQGFFNVTGSSARPDLFQPKIALSWRKAWRGAHSAAKSIGL
jgi:hypothetical protein